MKKSCYSLLGVSLVVMGLGISQMAKATSDIETFFSEAKKSEIQSHDIGPSEKDIKKATGKDISISINWDSFKGSSFNSSQELGADVQSITGAIVNGSEDAAFKAKMVKIKEIVIANDPKATFPKFSSKGDKLFFNGNFQQMNWSKAPKGMKSSIADAIK